MIEQRISEIRNARTEITDRLVDQVKPVAEALNDNQSIADLVGWNLTRFERERYHPDTAPVPYSWYLLMARELEPSGKRAVTRVLRAAERNDIKNVGELRRLAQNGELVNKRGFSEISELFVQMAFIG